MIDRTKYEKIVIPETLYDVIEDAIDAGILREQGSWWEYIWRKAGSVAAAFGVCLVVLLNSSPVFARAVSEIPVLGSVCSVFTFREYHSEDDIQYINVEIPKIENTGKSDLEKRINLEIQKNVVDRVEECEQVAKEYYESYIATGGVPEEFIPIGITVNYDVKLVTPTYVSFVITQYETAFSAYHCSYYYNIDLECGRVLTLRDWFGNGYREIVASSIEETIAGWEKEKRELLDPDLSVINLISENTDFYLNGKGQVVVVFDKYEAACGAAGILEFTIPEPTK